MNLDLVPFNIDLLTPTEADIKGLSPIKVLHIFEGSTRNFHPEGLYSTEIFGMVGLEKRSRMYAYIDLKVPVFHPVIYRAYSKLKQLYEGVMSGKEYAVWDKEKKDFIKSTPAEGTTGFYFFIKHYKDIVFEERDSTQRRFNIDLVNKHLKNCMFTKLIVLPAGLRDLEQDASGRPVEDEINNLYRQVIAKANLVSEQAYKIDPEGLSNIHYQIQTSVNAIYEYITILIDGKKKLILGKVASRKIQDGTRNVATSLINADDELFSPKLTKNNESRCGLYQYLKGTLILSCYYIKNGFISKVFISQNSPAVLVNKKTLKREMVSINPGYFDEWMTDEGLEKIITRYSIEELRHRPVEIEGHYLGLMYKGPDKTFKMFQDIDELPSEEMKQYVTPITLTELLYLSVYESSKRVSASVSRYPIAEYGSVYPCKVHLKTTISSESRTELDEQWMPIPENTAHEFPVASSSDVNSMSVASAHVNRLTLDRSFSKKDGVLTHF